MSEFIVTNTQYGANFRSKPSTSGAFVNLPFGTRLKLVEDDGGKWKKLEHNGEIGYVSDVNLTIVKTDAIARLIESCAYYWKIFERGAGKEMTDPYRKFVEQMWKDLGAGPPKDKKGRMITDHPSWPWSAAAISAFVRRASGYKGFKYSSQHSVFIHDSIQARDKTNGAPPFRGYKLSEKKAEVGDLVVQWRKRKQTYSSAKKSSNYKSHTDVICEVRPGYIWAIGGNIGPNSVSRKKYSIDARGHLLGLDGKYHSDKTVFMIMKNTAK